MVREHGLHDVNSLEFIEGHDQYMTDLCEYSLYSLERICILYLLSIKLSIRVNWLTELLKYILSSLFKYKLFSLSASKSIYTVLDLRWFNLRLFGYMVMGKWYTFSRNCTLNFDLWSLPGLSVFSTVFSPDAGLCSESQFLVSHKITRVHNRCIYNHAVPKQLLCFSLSVQYSMGFQGGASGKEPACQCRRHKRCGFNPWVGKIPWRRAWQPIPVLSRLENPMDRGARWSTVHRVAKSPTQLKRLSIQHTVFNKLHEIVNTLL